MGLNLKPLLAASHPSNPSSWLSKDLEDQWNQGFTAQSACCSCGGGRQPIAGADVSND